MALKVELKPSERIIIGNAVVTNGEHRTRLYIEGEAAILREKDILTPETADTPARRIYLAVQLMYLENDIGSMHETYLELTRDIVTAAPSTLPYIDHINELVMSGAFYKALKETKALIAYESELLSNATSGSTRIRADREDHRQPAEA
ncbi:MAG: flagellar biosynthesis repressor FlbT [Rhodobiaceae bacterium]|nr:flagellar biosynthesis repressor FlbT [Rhodobiaceae bacterium]MCC0060901.1 flagellar biosynthesis repressor FlbT [Rhodobiaceae bacterium]